MEWEPRESCELLPSEKPILPLGVDDFSEGGGNKEGVYDLGVGYEGFGEG